MAHRHAFALALLIPAALIPARPVASDPAGAQLPDDVSAAVQFRPQNDDEATAYSSALDLAFTNRDHMGYPWLDKTGVIEVRVTDTNGRNAAKDAEDELSRSGFAVVVSTVSASIADLENLADEVTRMTDHDAPDTDLIWKTTPDMEANRIVVTLTSRSDGLAKVLTERFGSDRLSLTVADAGQITAQSADRMADAPSYWGGAYITIPIGGGMVDQCTTGFAWNPGSPAGQSAMLTAAHCAASGGSVSYPTHPNAGLVFAGTEENWNTTVGTQYYQGQSVYRGDVALIRYNSDGSAPRIYNGGAGHTSANTGVWKMSGTWAAFGDSACLDGVVTGQWCGAVDSTGLNIHYIGDGPNVYARNVVEATAPGNACPYKGDSGAPVYRYRSDGNVVASGIFSGYINAGAFCSVYFTDIRDAWSALPGSIKDIQ